MVSSKTKERLRKLRQKYHLGEYRTSRPKKARKVRAKTRTRRVFYMARGRRASSRRGFLKGGRGSLMTGLFKPGATIQSVLAGYAVADVINSPMAEPIRVVPFADYLGSFAVGGVKGVIGAGLRNFLAGNLGGAVAKSGTALY